MPVRAFTLFVATIPVPASPSGGHRGIPAFNVPSGSKSPAPSSVRTPACSPARRGRGRISLIFHGTTGLKSFGQNSPAYPYNSFLFLRQQEHSRRIIHTQYPFSGKHPVHIACQRGDVFNIFYMSFSVQHRLIQMSDTPALGIG